MANALVATRLSHDTDASTSVERQREAGVKTAEIRGDTVIAVTEDVDVSGKVSPFQRPELGPWLTDPGKISKWDVIIIHKLDRLTRDMRHFDDFRIWCDAHGKTIVSVSESLDLSTSVGRMFAGLLAMFAQFERERMSERRKDAYSKTRRMGAWGGGKAPYGHDAVSDGAQFYLHVNEIQAEVIREIVTLILAGKSARQTASELNTRHVPAIKTGKRWDAGTVLLIVRNPIIHGVLTHNGKPVIGDDGMPVRIGESVIDDETWSRLQIRLDANKRRGVGAGGHQGTALLTGTVKCGCGEPLFIMRRPQGDRYRHNDRAQCGTSYLAKHLEDYMGLVITALFGDIEITKPALVKGKGYGAQITQIEAQITDLDTAYENGDIPAVTYGRMQGKLEAKLSEYRVMHDAVPADERDDKWVDIPTGVTYRERWAQMDVQSRNQFLRDNEITLTVAREVPADEIWDQLSPEGWDWRGKPAMIPGLGHVSKLAESIAKAA